MLIVTVRGKLEQMYGSDGYTSVRSALDDYAKSSRALVFAVDDRDDCRTLGLNPAPGADSGSILLAVRAARSKFATAADSLLIAGGDSVVPHFQLKNPVTDRILDQDTQVLTDNPYGATEDTLLEYLSPSVPVGRVVQPDGVCENFVSLLHSMAEARTSSGAALPGSALVVNEDWIEYSRSVAAEMAAPLDWHISPGYEMNSGCEADAGRSILYFNLHGFSGEAEWKGYSTTQGTFVTAVSPDAFVDTYVKGAIAFSECCYGAETQGRTASDSCALKLVSQGAAFIGATGLAYGSYLLPEYFLQDADFLARVFFAGLKGGSSIGTSLRNARRAYLSNTSENLASAAWQYKQKTLLQFVLFGDPRWTM